MKKILSLLSMLMITVMAFATDYTDQLKYEIGIGSNYYPVENAKGTLSITQYDNGNYQVTAKNCDFSSNPDVGSTVGNLGNLVCDGLSGTTDANGVTTIDVTECTAGLDGSSWIDMSSTKLLVKFKGDKAYATFTGKYRMSVFPYQWRTVSYTFGTDEGFEGGGSTGGGETGGETSSIVTVKENFQSTQGTNWGENVTIDWNTQKLVVSVNLASTGSDKGFLGVTKQGNSAGWNTDGIIFYNVNASTVQGYAPGQHDNGNTHYITKGEDPVRFEISKEGGVKCQGNVVISAALIAHLTKQSNIVVGAAAKPAGAFYNYIKVVPLNWTEVPPVTVDETFTYDKDAYVGTNNTNGTANVKVNKMSDGTYTMEITAPVTTKVGAITVGTDVKGRTTYIGEAESTVVSGVKYVVNGVVYEEGGAKHLYMTLTNDDVTYTIGKDPDYVAPVTYKNTLKVVRGTNTQTYENAEVSVLAKGEGMYEVTLPKFSGMDNVPGEWGPITFQAKGVEESGKVVLTATDQEFTLTNTGWKNDVVKVSMKGEIESEMLKATFNVNHSSMSGYNYTLYYGVEAPEIVTELSNKTYKSNLRIADQTSEDENAYLFQTDEATVNIIKYSDKTYKITLKQITLNEKTSDLVFTGKAVESEVDPGEGGVVETEGTMVQATADVETQNFLGGAVNAQFMWQDISDTEIRMSFVLEGKTLSLGGEFNYEKTPEPPVEPTFPMENYQADGKGFVVSTDIDWSKQKFQAIIDATKCNAASTEDIFGFGAEATAWFKNIHVYADKGSYKAYFQPAAGEDNNNKTVTIADQSNITIEVSKAEGLTVDGVVVIAAEQLTGIFDLTTVKFGSGENSQYSNALYKSVKLVDLPKDPETGINAINAAAANGEAQLFTVNGVKLNKLQKGLNIVRTADGKVKKVLVK
jgi:hypothetical protein